MTNRFILVADDFTGANDTGVQFRKSGLNVKVVINPDFLKEEPETCDILVVDLESRMDSPRTAYKKSFSLGKQLNESGRVIVYKKLDSTFRGNIGAEFDGLMDGLNINSAVLAPAFPSGGRTTVNGEVFVKGIRLGDSEYAGDPRTPVMKSRISEIIGMQSSRPCHEISGSLTGNDSGEISEMIKRMKKDPGIYIFDSQTEEDLEQIARIAENIEDIPLLLAGSAGFAGHLRNSTLIRSEALSFVFSGSVTEISLTQISHSSHDGNCSVILVDPLDLLNDRTDQDEIMASVSQTISDGVRRIIFTTALSHEDVEKVFRFTRQKSFSLPLTAEKISVSFGKLAARMILKFHPTGILLTGGETAFRTVEALRATGLIIEGELFPGIASGRLTGCQVRGTVVTKSGGFGDVEAISKIFEFFRV
jgi:D-threonate/D-erythronate kinase